MPGYLLATMLLLGRAGAYSDRSRPMRGTLVAVMGSLVVVVAGLAGPVIGLPSAKRQGALNLVDSSGATQFKADIVGAYPSAAFVPMEVLTAGGLAGCDAVVLAAGAAGQDAITPLTTDERNALRGFVNGGGGAVVFSD